MEIFLQGNGKMIKHMVMEFMNMLMVFLIFKNMIFL